MNKYTIIPSSLQYKAAPDVDLEINLNLQSTSQELIEYDRSATISLAQVYDDERQECSVFRPTFKVTYLYNNTITGTTNYLPFQYNLYYIQPVESKATNVWKGFPQYYEFDFYRPDIKDQHLNYKSKSAFTYNWMYYITYPSENSYNKKLRFSSDDLGNFEWEAKEGIPFSILNTKYNGTSIISFKCIASHGLSVGEYVQLSFSYASSNIFQVYNLGDGTFGSDEYIFNIINIGYTGNTFDNKTTGVFKRVINPDNFSETLSSYYVRRHKIMKGVEDVLITKNGFEKNVFGEERKFEYNVLTPNNVSRISQKTSSNSYNFTVATDIDVRDMIDNQKRPLTEIYLTIINKGYTGYFNYSAIGSGIKQGWEFNLNKQSSSWWDANNFLSDTNIPTEKYTRTNGSTKTFYYNKNLNVGDLIDGDFCEWNDYEQKERVISKYYQKIKYNPTVFQTTNLTDTNSPGYYYEPHNKITIRTFSDYIETGSPNKVENIPSYAFFSRSDREFRWRDLYSYGFVDELKIGVDDPFLNTAHYPYTNVIFRLIPEGINYSDKLQQGNSFSVEPIIDDCE